MTDFGSMVSQQRDRITKILNREAPPTEDIVRAGIRQIGGTPYAQTIGDLEQKSLAKAKMGLDIATGEREAALAERGMGLRERQVDLQEAQLFLDKATAKAAAAGKEGEQFLKWMEIYKDVGPQGLAKLAIGARQKLKSGMTDIDQAFSQTAAELGLEKGAKEYAPSEYQKLLDARNRALDEGDTKTAADLQKRLDKLSSGEGQDIYVETPEGFKFSMTPSQKGKLAQEDVQSLKQSQGALAEISTALDKVNKTPGATGVRGWLTENVGGLVEQLPVVGDAAGKWLNTAEVQNVRTQLRTLIGRTIKSVTGDESGRYSDKDMQLAEAALQATEPTASISQVRSALETMKDIEQRAEARIKLRSQGLPDITYREGQLRYANELFQGGMDKEKAIQSVIDLVKKYRIPFDG